HCCIMGGPQLRRRNKKSLARAVFVQADSRLLGLLLHGAVSFHANCHCVSSFADELPASLLTCSPPRPGRWLASQLHRYGECCAQVPNFGECGVIPRLAQLVWIGTAPSPCGAFAELL